ncbi:MAG: hypothetical protein JWN76_739 [Chitinophagaceae bacterium]|nr:hypothetical protein [Chitinophagaceae bacterium]
MTPQEIQIIRNSWEHAKKLGFTAGELFYQNLFEYAPSVRPLFKADIKMQAVKLLSMITVVVDHLHELDVISGDLVKLAERHNGYGAKPEHYSAVGICLIKTLEQGLGENWSADAEAAWLKAYGILSAVMIQAQADAVIV